MTAPMTEMAPIRFGGLEVARVEEMIWTVSPRYLYAGIQNERFEPYRDWLAPHFSTEDFKWRLSIHTFVVRTPHHTIVVDTCVGNDRKRSLPIWDHMRTDYSGAARRGRGETGGGGLRLLHPHARRPRRLEHPARQRTLRPDLSERGSTSSTAPSGNTGRRPRKRSRPRW